MTFEAYHAAHLAALAAAAATVAAIVGWRRRLRRPRAKRAAKAALIALLAGSELTFDVFYGFANGWDASALPFQLCSLTLLLSIALLLTGSRRLYEITFFLGTIGAVQALLTPDLLQTFPDFRYFQFFAAHIAIVGANVFMTAVERYRPTLGSVFRSLGWLHVLAIPAFATNAATGTNFMYLARKPSAASLLDMLGPWPWYLLELEAVALLLCLLLLGIVRAADRWAGEAALERS